MFLGDAFYATYLLLHAMQERGIDGIFEQHGSRKKVTDSAAEHGWAGSTT